MKSCILLCLLVALAVNITTTKASDSLTICKAEEIVTCNNFGFLTCSTIDEKPSCLCDTNNTFTELSNVLEKRLTCSRDTGVWYNPYHWLLDLTIPTFLAALAFGLITTIYAVFTYAYTRALYEDNPPSEPLHYIPFLGRSNHNIYERLNFANRPNNPLSPNYENLRRAAAKSRA